MSRKKDQSIETLRGLAIILMVAGHVIGGTVEDGMRVADDSAYRHLHFSMQFLRMPLFTVISGFVYAMRPVSSGMAGGFVRGKMRRLLLPMVFVGTLEFLMRAAVPGVNNPVLLGEVWRVYVYPFDHFWFLQAIFLAFLTVVVLERFRLLDTPLSWAGCVVVALLVEWNPPALAYSIPFSFVSYLYLLPFFLFGVGLNRFEGLMRSPSVVVPAALALTWGVTWQQAHWYGWDLPLSESLAMSVRGNWLSSLVGLSGCVVLFRLRWTTSWLVWLGSYAFGIYLFHVFGTAGARILLQRSLGWETESMVFLFSLVAGLGVPILIERAVDRFSAARFVFLGLRPVRRAVPVPLSTADPLRPRRATGPQGHVGVAGRDPQGIAPIQTESPSSERRVSP